MILKDIPMLFDGDKPICKAGDKIKITLDTEEIYIGNYYRVYSGLRKYNIVISRKGEVLDFPVKDIVKIEVIESV